MINCKLGDFCQPLYFLKSCFNWQFIFLFKHHLTFQQSKWPSRRCFFKMYHYFYTVTIPSVFQFLSHADIVVLIFCTYSTIFWVNWRILGQLLKVSTVLYPWYKSFIRNYLISFPTLTLNSISRVELFTTR